MSLSSKAYAVFCPNVKQTLQEQLHQSPRSMLVHMKPYCAVAHLFQPYQVQRAYCAWAQYGAITPNKLYFGVKCLRAPLLPLNTSICFSSCTYTAQIFFMSLKSPHRLCDPPISCLFIENFLEIALLLDVQTTRYQYERQA